MSCRGISATEFERILRSVLSDVAVPKPSRTAELYAALTLAIVINREEAWKLSYRIDHEPNDIKLEPVRAGLKIVSDEIARLEAKRAELEETLEAGGA